MVESRHCTRLIALLAAMALAGLFGPPASLGAQSLEPGSGGTCAEGSMSGPDCLNLPAGHVGFAVEIFIDGVRQFFAPGDFPAAGDAAATQGASGVVVLSGMPCVGVVEEVGCLSLAIVHGIHSRPFAAGTTVNFKVVRVSGLPAPATVANCRLVSRRPQSGTIAGAEVDISAAAVGNNSVTLAADEPHGITILCEVTSQQMI